MGKRSMLRFKFFGTHPSICNTMRGAMIRGVLTTSMGSTSDDPSGPSLFSYLCDKRKPFNLTAILVQVKSAGPERRLFVT